jgi:hypothetical protein
MEEIISDFKYIKIPRGLQSSQTTLGAFDGGTSMGLGRSMSVMYARLLTEEDINKVKDKFHEDTDIVLEEAIRKHVILI